MKRVKMRGKGEGREKGEEVRRMGDGRDWEAEK